MRRRLNQWTWPALVMGVLWIRSGTATAQLPDTTESRHQESGLGVPTEPGGTFHPALAAHGFKAIKVPLDKVAPNVRERVRRVLDKPTIFTHGPAEVFRGRLALYQWLLGHPNRGVRAWRLLGAKCLDITDLGGGRFGWTDGEGTEIHWDGVYADDHMRVWYAEGSSRPAPLLPAVPVQAVVVLRFGEIMEGTSNSLIYQQADLSLHTDSKTAALVAKLLGASVPRLAEQGIAQLEMFFSALVWYFDRHPERAEALFGCLPTGASQAPLLPSTLNSDGLGAPDRPPNR